jgi:hypothetical protein
MNKEPIYVIITRDGDNYQTIECFDMKQFTSVIAGIDRDGLEIVSITQVPQPFLPEQSGDSTH